jgi:hypothetical protein
MGRENYDLDLEWERRTLCSDGNCIGVIGPDGKCKECGKSYEGDLPETDGFEERSSNETEEYGDGSGTESEMATGITDDYVEDVDDLDSEWENRRLCSDGGCIGVIGPDGRCKECGKPYEG